MTGLLPGFRSVLCGLCCALLLTLLPAVAARAEPSPEVIREAAASLVRIRARDCPVDQQGSGFVWAQPDRIVTALHVVADCASLQVDYLAQDVSRPAAVERVLPDADLVLLRVTDPPDGVRPLRHSTAMPEEDAALVAIGLPLNIPAWHSFVGRRSLNVRILRNILPDEAQQRLREVGVPALELEIIGLTAVLRPGSSGGPVIDASGLVVGVADGGLDGGVSQLNWAVPARFLDDLLASEERVASLGGRSADLFAFSAGGEEPARVNDSIRCGEREYFLLATRSLGDIVGSVAQPGMLDDPAGFLLMLQGMRSAVPDHELEALEFALWVDEGSGATIAVPNTMTLESADGGCLARSGATEIALVFRGADLGGGGNDVQAASLDFERDLVASLAAQCWPDPVWGQLVPHVRPQDGLMVRRQGYYCQFSGGLVNGYGSVAHFARDGDFLSMAAIHAEAQGIIVDPEVRRQWAAAALAVMISTFQL